MDHGVDHVAIVEGRNPMSHFRKFAVLQYEQCSKWTRSSCCTEFGNGMLYCNEWIVMSWSWRNGT